MKNLTEFINALRQLGQVHDVFAPVDPQLELAEIHRRVIENQGPVLIFHNVKGSSFPVCTNLFGSLERIRLAFGPAPEEAIENFVSLLQDKNHFQFSSLWKKRKHLKRFLCVGTRHSFRSAPVLECQIPLDSPEGGLTQLPALKQWPDDGGCFLTLPLVYTEHPKSGNHNLGMYRIQIYDHKTTGIHWQIHKGGGYHYHAAELENAPLPVTIFLGGPPALMLSAIAPLPENVPELLLASFLMGKKLNRSFSPNFPHAVVSEAEFALQGWVKPKERRLEGPFGDHYGYYSLAHEYPVFHAQHIFHKKGAIFPATVVGKPRQEDFYIGEYLQKLLSPIFPIVMPSVKSLRTYGETGFHALASAVVYDRYEREAIASGLRILGEGQLTLQKFLMLTDGNVDLDNFPSLLSYFLERTNWNKDRCIIGKVSQDTLDYSGPKVNEGSKGIWLALGKPVRRLNTELKGLPQGVREARYFVPGCLVVSGPTYEQEKGFCQRLAQSTECSHIPLIVVVDDVSQTISSTQSFLWGWFTRFEPAADIYGNKQRVERFHVGLEPPVVFDSRMKPWYPGTVEPLPETVQRVDTRWHEFGLN